MQTMLTVVTQNSQLRRSALSGDRMAFGLGTAISASRSWPCYRGALALPSQAASTLRFIGSPPSRPVTRRRGVLAAPAPGLSHLSRTALRPLLHCGLSTVSELCVHCLQVPRLQDHLFADQIDQTS